MGFAFSLSSQCALWSTKAAKSTRFVFYVSSVLKDFGAPAQTREYLDSFSQPTGHQRGCVTTSSSAGSPRWTTATARRIAGASSFGSLIGPSAYQPMLWASFA